jgi:hypothetical protein
VNGPRRDRNLIQVFLAACRRIILWGPKSAGVRYPALPFFPILALEKKTGVRPFFFRDLTKIPQILPHPTPLDKSSTSHLLSSTTFALPTWPFAVPTRSLWCFDCLFRKGESRIRTVFRSPSRNPDRCAPLFLAPNSTIPRHCQEAADPRGQIVGLFLANVSLFCQDYIFTVLCGTPLFYDPSVSPLHNTHWQILNSQQQRSLTPP